MKINKRIQGLLKASVVNAVQLTKCRSSDLENSLKQTNIPMNRWLVVAGAILIQLAMGAIYAWSVFTARLTDPAGDYQFTASETACVFSAGLATFAIVMVFAGRLLPRVNYQP